jgi:hypothetical protein
VRRQPLRSRVRSNLMRRYDLADVAWIAQGRRVTTGKISRRTSDETERVPIDVQLATLSGRMVILDLWGGNSANRPKVWSWHEVEVSRVQEFFRNGMESGHAADIVTPPPLTLAVSKPSKHSPARNKRIELATRANPSCASGILFESILRSNDSQNGFHIAKTRNGSSRASIGAEGLVPVHPQHSQRGRARASGMVAERGMPVQVPANATREPPAFASARLCRRGSMISPG